MDIKTQTAQIQVLKNQAHPQSQAPTSLQVSKAAEVTQTLEVRPLTKE